MRATWLRALLWLMFVAHFAVDSGTLAAASSDPALSPPEFRLATDRTQQLVEKGIELVLSEGDVGQGVRCFEEALSLTTASLGPTNRDVAIILNGLSEVHLLTGDLAKAGDFARRSLEIGSAALGANDPVVANALKTLAIIKRTEAKYAEAEALAAKSLAIFESKYGKDHLAVAYCLKEIGMIYADEAKFAQALEALYRSLAIQERSLGPEHPYVAALLSVLARVHIAVGDGKRAAELTERSLAIRRTNLGPTSPAFAEGLLNLGMLYADQGHYSRAEPLMRRGIEIQETVLGSGSPTFAASLEHLAALYHARGDFETELSLLNRCYAIKAKALGETHPDLAEPLEAMGCIFSERGRTEDAMKLFGLCLKLRLDAYGNQHPKVAETLLQLSWLFLRTGDYAQAARGIEGALEIEQKTRGPDHPDVGVAVSYLAVLQAVGGQYDEAATSLHRSLQILEKSYGPVHPEVMQNKAITAFVDAKRGRVQESVAALGEVFQTRREYLTKQLIGVSPAAALRISVQGYEDADFLQSLCALAETRSTRLAQTLGAEQPMLMKASYEEVEIARVLLEADPRTSTRQLGTRLRVAWQGLEALASEGLGSEERDERRRLLEREINSLLSELAACVGLQGQALSLRPIHQTEVASALPLQAVLVDIVHYRRKDFAVKVYAFDVKEPRYAAYLTFPLAKESTNVVVERLDLGEAAPIDEAVAELHRLMRAGQIASRRLDPVIQRLSDLVYAPLAKHLTNVEHLIVCPDGQLNRLPFELLRHGGKYLAETKTVTYVTSGREVARLAEGKGPKPKAQSPKALVMGNPDFNLDLAGSAGPVLVADSRAGSRIGAEPAPSSSLGTNGISAWLASLPPSAAEVAQTRSLSRSFFAEPGATNSTVRDAAARGLVFAPLPQAEEEAKAVAAVLGEEALLRVGRDAREAELKSTNSPRVLHLATHGFFLPDQEFKATNSLRDSWLGGGLSIGGDGFNRRRFGPPGEAWENPLVRCGLALAGANRALQITNAVAEDGLLTGLEASLLNLQGTELVILSACDTGSGDVKIGEGVMSLRRAFRIAGAETVLASHWPVSDQATKLLMTEFMRRWRAGTPRGQAWREAQLELLRSKDYSSPYFWAAFTLTGQWR